MILTEQRVTNADVEVAITHMSPVTSGSSEKPAGAKCPTPGPERRRHNHARMN
jgi:hypothetical protein